MGAIAGGNSLDFLKGVLAQIDVSAYIAAGAAGTFTYLRHGFMDDIEIEEFHESADVEADNSTYPLAGYPTKSGLKIKGNFIEASLRKKSVALGSTTAAVVVAAGSATRPITELSTVTEYQVQLTIANQSMKPAHTEHATDVYIKSVVTLWKCRYSGKASQKLKGVVKTPFEITAYWDTSVTESVTKGAIGIEVDSTT